MNEEKQKLISEIRRLGAKVFENSNVVVYNTKVLQHIPRQIFDRYIRIEESLDEITRKNRINTLKTHIMYYYDMDQPSNWIPIETFISGLNDEQIELLKKEVEAP